MAEPLSTALTGVKAASTAISLVKQAKELGLTERLINIFKKKHRILILGATGVGKSQLMQSLVKEIPQAIGNMNRTEFKNEFRLKIAEDIFVFADTPGQEHHKSRRTNAIREEMEFGIDGIINVVSYGYHESRIGRKEVFDDDGSIKKEFLSKRRKVEIEQLREWTEILGDRETSKWLITLINKADLWWDDKDDILSYYEKGAYFKSLGSAKNLSPGVLTYCAVFHKFYGESPLSGLFDDNDRIEVKENFLAQLISAIGKGGLK